MNTSFNTSQKKNPPKLHPFTHINFYNMQFSQYHIKLHNKGHRSSLPSASYSMSQTQSSCSHLVQAHYNHSEPVPSCWSSSNVR